MRSLDKASIPVWTLCNIEQPVCEFSASALCRVKTPAYSPSAGRIANVTYPCSRNKCRCKARRSSEVALKGILGACPWTESTPPPEPPRSSPSSK